MLFILCINYGYAQKKDTLSFYKKIKAVAYKHKITAQAFDAVFVDPEPIEYPTIPTAKVKKEINPYLKYEGRIIKDIIITVYDPFGHNVNDTIFHNINKSQRFGNKIPSASSSK